MGVYKPNLFGLDRSDKDFSSPEEWGKNRFNNAFPIALSCYMSHKGIKPVYIELDTKLKVVHTKISFSEVFGIDPMGKETHFSFEAPFHQYGRFIEGKLPRIDLVISKRSESQFEQVKGLEIKLTALPDNSTVMNKDDEFGSEIVVRPDTIVYLALSIVSCYEKDRKKLFNLLNKAVGGITNWRDPAIVSRYLPKLCSVLDKILLTKIDSQKPLLIQPIWKTQGKRMLLHKNCLDVFVWSDFAFTRLFLDVAKNCTKSSKINRPSRSLVWLVKMLYDYSSKGKIDTKKVIDSLTYKTKNDKAFSVNGTVTKRYMHSKELTKPRMNRECIREIILGSGEKLLSPERRLDAGIMNTPGLF